MRTRTRAGMRGHTLGAQETATAVTGPHLWPPWKAAPHRVPGPPPAPLKMLAGRHRPQPGRLARHWRSTSGALPWQPWTLRPTSSGVRASWLFSNSGSLWLAAGCQGVKKPKVFSPRNFQDPEKRQQALGRGIQPKNGKASGIMITPLLTCTVARLPDGKLGL